MPSEEAKMLIQERADAIRESANTEAYDQITCFMTHSEQNQEFMDTLIEWDEGVEVQNFCPDFD